MKSACRLPGPTERRPSHDHRAHPAARGRGHHHLRVVLAAEAQAGLSANPPIARGRRLGCPKHRPLTRSVGGSEPSRSRGLSASLGRPSSVQDRPRCPRVRRSPGCPRSLQPPKTFCPLAARSPAPPRRSPSRQIQDCADARWAQAARPTPLCMDRRARGGRPVENPGPLAKSRAESRRPAYPQEPAERLRLSLRRRLSGPGAPRRPARGRRPAPGPARPASASGRPPRRPRAASP